MDKKIIINIPFTGLSKGFSGQEWFNFRAEIFNKYTLKSLVNQKDKDFLLWVTFRPEEKDNEVTKRIEEDIKEAGIDYVFTFDGTMFYDDKQLEQNKTLRERLKKSLKVIKGHIGSEKYVYLTLLGSDDMFAEDIIEIIRKTEWKNGRALYMRDGYVYNDRSEELADWNNPFSVGNYTLLYETDEFLHPERHMMKQNNLTTHELIPNIYLAEEIKDRKYCCVVHGMNISTLWKHKYKGKQYFYDKDKQPILKKFGL